MLAALLATAAFTAAPCTHAQLELKLGRTEGAAGSFYTPLRRSYEQLLEQLLGSDSEALQDLAAFHISELGHGRVFRARDVVSEGQEVEVKILSVDEEAQRISLSLKALMSAPVKPGQQKVEDEDMPLPAGAPKPPRKRNQELKGGTGGPTGGDKFGLKW